MGLIIVPIALFFGLFFRIAAIQALRKNWKWAALALTASLIAPLVFILPMFLQIGEIKKATKRLEHTVQSQTECKTNGIDKRLHPTTRQDASRVIRDD
jgi:uncharacterized protein YpmS